MTIDKDMLKHYSQPGCNPLREMTDAAHANVLATLVAAVVHGAALELADALEGEPLQKLREVAAEPLTAVKVAQDALDAEKAAVHTRLADFHGSPARKSPNDREHPPADTSPRLQELQATLDAAAQEATGPESRVRAFGYKIAELRATPAPDTAILAMLAEALVGGHLEACPPRNSASMATTQAPQGAAMKGAPRDSD